LYSFFIVCVVIVVNSCWFTRTTSWSDIAMGTVCY